MLLSNGITTVSDRELNGQGSTGTRPDWLQAVSVAGYRLDRLRLRYQLCLLAADLLAGTGAVLLARYLVLLTAASGAQVPLVPHLVVMIACWLATSFVSQLYTLTVRHPLMRLFDAYSSLLVGTITAISVLFLINPAWLSARLFYLLAYAIAAALNATARIIAAGLVADELIKNRVAVLGTDETARQVIDQLSQDGATADYDLVGAVRSGEEPGDVQDVNLVPVIGDLHDCPHVLLQHLVNTLIISQTGPFSEEVARCLAQCDAVGIRVVRFEAAYETLTQRAAVFNVGPDWLASLETVRYNKYATRLKRVLDMVLTILLLPLAAVLVGLSAVLIKLLSPGPVFYQQTRVGKDGAHFRFTKLRTMIPDAENGTGPVWAKLNDPRVTPIGRVLRRTRLDELPQLLHVLKGEMSLIGPRPERPEIVERLKEEIPLYDKRLIVRPGISGWAQVNHKYDASTEDVIEKLRYDLYYIRNLSFSLDLQIFLRTIGVMLSKKGAH